MITRLAVILCGLALSGALAFIAGTRLRRRTHGAQGRADEAEEYSIELYELAWRGFTYRWLNAQHWMDRMLVASSTVIVAVTVLLITTSPFPGSVTRYLFQIGGAPTGREASAGAGASTGSEGAAGLGSHDGVTAHSSSQPIRFLPAPTAPVVANGLTIPHPGQVSPGPSGAPSAAPSARPSPTPTPTPSASPEPSAPPTPARP